MEPGISTFVKTVIPISETSTRILIAAAVVLFATLALSVVRRRGATTPDQAAAMFQSLDIAAFRNLVDPAEESFLRENLPPAKFRSIKRQRVKAALLYTWDVVKAAGALVVVGQAARRNPDPAIAESGLELLHSALRLRLQAVQALFVLAGEYLRPDRAPGPLASLLDQHQQLAEVLVRLDRSVLHS